MKPAALVGQIQYGLPPGPPDPSISLSGDRFDFFSVGGFEGLIFLNCPLQTIYPPFVEIWALTRADNGPPDRSLASRFSEKK